MVLLSMPQLEELSLSGNQIGDAGLNQLCVGLEECCQLTHLWLDDIGMTSSQSITAISQLLNRLNKLQRLAIDTNPYVGSRKDMELCDAVRGHPSLETLRVPQGMSCDSTNRLQIYEADQSRILQDFAAW